MKHPLKIIKIGGHILDDSKAKKEFLTQFAAIDGFKLLVHGGGKSATELSQKMQLEVQMVNGRRITDVQTLEVITMVYAGKINTSIVATLQQLDCNAVGCSGADANSIQSKKRPVSKIDYGFVGDIQNVNTAYISLLLNANYTPVFSALTHNKKGQLLNTNADTIAAALAKSLTSVFDVSLYYCFEKKGVLLDINNDNSVLKKMNKKTYMNFMKSGVISDGMLPKLQNCFDALEHNVSKVCIGQPGMLSDPSNSYTTLTL